MPTPRLLEVDSHTIAAFSVNQNRPGLPQAVFLHGIMSSPRFWLPGQTRLFDEGYTWHALSLPGHYPGAFPPAFCRADLTPEMVADVLAGAIRQLTGGAPALLFGHSTGGFAALAVAARHPDLARAVVSVSGFAHGRWTGVLGILQWLARSGPLTEALFRTNLYITDHIPALFRASAGLYTTDRAAFYKHPTTDATLDILFEDARQLDYAAMAHYFNRMPDIDISAWLPQIGVPVLALAGDRDPIVPPQQTRLIAERVQQGELVMIGGAGHVPMTERDAAYSAAVTGWLKKLEAGALAGQRP